jgi:hypothetical protein
MECCSIWGCEFAGFSAVTCRALLGTIQDLAQFVKETNLCALTCGNVSARHRISCCSKPDDAEECATSKSATSGKVVRRVPFSSQLQFPSSLHQTNVVLFINVSLALVVFELHGFNF